MVSLHKVPYIIIRTVGVLLGVLFPFIVYFAISRKSDLMMAGVLVALGLFAFVFSGRRDSGVPGAVLCTLDFALAAVFLASGSFLAVKLYPLIVTGSFLSFFAMSLFPGRTPVIEKIASYTVKAEDRDDFFRNYCRKVTVAWCVFFVMNGLVSLATALFCSDETWTLYNGVISYVLIGMMFTAEYIIRIILRKRRKSGTDDTEKL